MMSQLITKPSFCRDSNSSDNDSGVCADSGSEQSCPSPNCSLTNIPLGRSNRCANGHPTLTPSLKVRKESSRSRSQTRFKPMRVRFADEVQTADCETVDNNCLVFQSSSTSEFVDNMSVKFSSCRITRPKQVDNFQLPYSQDFIDDVDSYANLLRAKSSDFAKSMENLSQSTKSVQPNVAYRNTLQSSTNTRIPSAIKPEPQLRFERSSCKPKFAHSMTQSLRKLAYNSNFDSIQATFTHPSVGSDSSHNAQQPCVNNSVRARLLSIDSRGVQAVELEKCSKHSPFGFYISTGTYMDKTGIFVSRVNDRSLNSLLNVGDQIVEIDNVSIKGRTLEQAQLMMTNKNRVVLKIRSVSL